MVTIGSLSDMVAAGVDPLTYVLWKDLNDRLSSSKRYKCWKCGNVTEGVALMFAAGGTPDYCLACWDVIKPAVALTVLTGGKWEDECERTTA